MIRKRTDSDDLANNAKRPRIEEPPNVQQYSLPHPYDAGTWRRIRIVYFQPQSLRIFTDDSL